MGKDEAFSGTAEASQWEGRNFPVRREDASLWKVMNLPGGNGASFLVEWEQAAWWKGSMLPGKNGRNLPVGRQESST